MQKGRKKFCCFILALALVLAGTGMAGTSALAEAADERKEEKNSTTSQLYAQSAVLMDAENGRVLLQKNGYDVMPMASTTKIMTCILTLEQGNTADMAAVSSYAQNQPKVRLGAKKGEVYRIGDLLYALMLESYNDAAVIIAEYYGSKWAGLSAEGRCPGLYGHLFCHAKRPGRFADRRRRGTDQRTGAFHHGP